MTAIRATAPGKVVLSGEYAVLGGAPAVAMAVDRRAVVTIRPGAGDTLRSSGVVTKPDPRLLEHVRAAAGGTPVRGAVHLDTSAFVDSASGMKLGIGSSAALTVALARAQLPADTPAQRVQAVASAAHRAFQGGLGSGVDIATALAGGLVRFRMGEPPEALAWPNGLRSALLWSGVAATTRERLQKQAGAEAQAALRPLIVESGRVAACWAAADAAALLAAYRDYVAALARFGVDRGLGIFDAGHDRLASRAAGAGLVYKPCGAGGGDVGIVLGTDADAVEAFGATAEQHGFMRLDIGIDPVGGQLEAGDG